MKSKTIIRVITTLDTEEITAMFRACYKKTFTWLRDLTLLKAILDTGTRFREIALLRTEDIFWNESLIRLDGKGKKERFVPLSSDLKKSLREYLNERGKLPIDEVFITLGNTSMSRRTIQCRIKDIAQKAKGERMSSSHIHIKIL